jgi:hypothetical protein
MFRLHLVSKQIFGHMMEQLKLLKKQCNLLFLHNKSLNPVPFLQRVTPRFQIFICSKDKSFSKKKKKEEDLVMK